MLIGDAGIHFVKMRTDEANEDAPENGESKKWRN